MSEMNEEEQRLVHLLAEMEEQAALALSNKMLLDDKKDPMRVLQLCHVAMDIVRQRCEAGEYSLPELVLADDMLGQVEAVARPLLPPAEVAAQAFPGLEVEGVTLRKQWLGVAA